MQSTITSMAAIAIDSPVVLIWFSLMMLIVVEADSDVSTSEQVTTVPFNPSLVPLIVKLDTSGMLLYAEALEKVNKVEFTHKFRV